MSDYVDGRRNYFLAPFSAWRSALTMDESGNLEEAKQEFKKAAELFYDTAKDPSQISVAFFEYTTLMEAFSILESARIMLSSQEYGEALSLFSKATEIMRSTLHFGYLSAYTSACASMDVALQIDKNASGDRFQAYKNAIALLEQSRIALNFRDDNHPIMLKLEAILKSAMAHALFEEGNSLREQGNNIEAEKRYAQFIVLNNEYLDLVAKTNLRVHSTEYFLPDDWFRAENGSFIVSYSLGNNLLLANLGKNNAVLKKLANASITVPLRPFDSITLPLKDIPKGRLRVSYLDEITGREYEEGCLSLI